jgi:hypothetical protein
VSIGKIHRFASIFLTGTVDIPGTVGGAVSELGEPTAA